MAEMIKCPSCGEQIELSEALSHEMKDAMQKRFEVQLTDAVQKAEARSKESMRLELCDLQQQLMEKDQKMQSMEKQELELRKRQRALEDREKNQALELERRLAEERQTIEKAALESAEEKHQIFHKQKDLKIEELTRQITDLKRRADQGSMQAQGDAAELTLDEKLKSLYPTDKISRVGKGQKGGDIIQDIVENFGRILWEVKRTKAWANSWTGKLKKNMQEGGADIGIIVIEAMAKDVKDYAQLDGVWVVSFSFVHAVSLPLRVSLSQLHKARSAIQGQDRKMQMAYQYLTGPKFATKIASCVEQFQRMRDDLNSERARAIRQFSEREAGLVVGLNVPVPEIECLSLEV